VGEKGLAGEPHPATSAYVVEVPAFNRLPRRRAAISAESPILLLFASFSFLFVYLPPFLVHFLSLFLALFSLCSCFF
jgi:hypothetical protein